MYIEGVPGFQVAATEESLGFLQEKIIDVRGQYGGFKGITNSLFDDLGFENIPSDSR